MNFDNHYNKEKKILSEANFAIGDIVEIINSKLRGVIFDVDVSYNDENKSLTIDTDNSNYYSFKDLNENIINQPWYSILLDDSDEITYIPEYMLAQNDDYTPINNPLLNEFLVPDFDKGCYITTILVN